MAFWTPAGVPTTSRLATRQEHWLRRVTAYVEHRQYQVVRSPAQLLWNGSVRDRKSTRLNSSHVSISYAVFCLNKKKPAAPPPPGEAALIRRATRDQSAHRV